MSACKVEFITENGQKIVLDFSVNDKGFVEYKCFLRSVIVQR